MEVAEVLNVFGKVRAKDVVGIGTVKFYDNAPTKQFGFLESENGDVYFHGTRAAQIANTGNDVPGLIEASRNLDKSLMHSPKRGDKILFMAEESPRGGLRALSWMRFDETEIDAVLKEIELRPTYRVIQRKGHRIQSKKLHGGAGGFKTLWEGKNVEELRKRFPQHDPRYRVVDTDDGAFYFEVLTNGIWESTDDPR